MLIAERTNWFKRNYILKNDDEHLAQISLSNFQEKASFTVNNRTIEIIKSSLFKSQFELILNDVPLANANKVSAWKNDTLITVSSQEFLMKPKNWMTREFEVIYSGRRIGNIKPKNWYSSSAHLTLPVTIPLEVQVFMLVITLFYWNRQAAAASS